jgi:hypothetical protein
VQTAARCSAPALGDTVNMLISCKKCGTIFSKNVDFITSDAVLSLADGSDYVPVGLAYKEAGEFWPSHRGTWYLNKEDTINIVPINNPQRLNGCCNLDGCDGPNMVCSHCGEEVATAKLDCWMPHAIIFEECTVNVFT